MAFVGGFAPWILYWILTGNVDFRLAVCLSLALAVVFQVIARLRHQPWRSLDVGSLIIFVLLALAAFVVSDAFLAQWLQPLSNLGLFAVALVGLAIGRPFVREYATDTVDADTARTDGFRYITTAITWLWVVAFALMTIVSAIPPLVDGSAVIDDDSALSILCYWVLPYTLLGLTAAVSMIFPKWFDRRTAEIDRREIAETPEVAPAAAAPPDETGGRLAIDAPAETGHEQPLPIRVLGVAAGQSVDVTTSGVDLFGREWRSRASFVVTSDNTLDTAVDAPSAGDWSGNDAGAPVWAMRFAERQRTPELFVPPLDPWQVTIRAEVPGVGSAQHTVRRRAAAPDVRAQPVEIGSQPGLLARPAGPPPPGGWPAVACFGGSEGGFESQTGHALLLASHGYVALAACWLPGGEAASNLASLPLERFGTSLEWLGGQHDVDAGRITAMAVSRGAEGLLAALTRDEERRCRGLVLVSPSSVTWQAMGNEGSIPDTGAWTWRGQPTPWLRIPTGALMPQIIRNAWRIGRDTASHKPTLLTLRPAYEAGLHECQTTGGDPRIDAARLDFPLLVLTGGADAIWPSERMTRDLLASRSAAAGDEHQHYPGAGHLIRLGVLPTDAQWTGGITLGGTRSDQAAAQADATARVLAFLTRVT